MIQKLQAGPFAVEVLASEELAALDTLHAYHPVRGAPMETLAIDFLGAAPIFDSAPTSAKVLADNWRIWPEEGGYRLQFWCGLVNAYALDAKVSSDFLRAELRVLEGHPFRTHAGFLLTSLLRWLASVRAVKLGGGCFTGQFSQKGRKQWQLWGHQVLENPQSLLFSLKLLGLECGQTKPFLLFPMGRGPI